MQVRLFFVVIFKAKSSWNRDHQLACCLPWLVFHLALWKRLDSVCRPCCRVTWWQRPPRRIVESRWATLARCRSYSDSSHRKAIAKLEHLGSRRVSRFGIALGQLSKVKNNNSKHIINYNAVSWKTLNVFRNVHHVATNLCPIFEVWPFCCRSSLFCSFECACKIWKIINFLKKVVIHHCKNK